MILTADPTIEPERRLTKLRMLHDSTPLCQVTNTGNVDLTEMDIWDPTVDHDCAEDANLAVGSEYTCSGIYHLKWADIVSKSKETTAT